MKLRVKFILIAVIAICFFVIIIVFSMKKILLNYVEMTELHNVSDDYKRAAALLDRESHSVENTVLDWSKWDDSYQYIENRNPVFIDSNMQDSTFRSLNLNFIIYLDKQKNIIYFKQFDAADKMESIFTDKLLREIKKTKQPDRLYAGGRPLTGVISVDGIPVLLSMSGVTDSNGTARVNGLLIMGRQIGKSTTDYFSKALNLAMDIKNFRQSEIRTYMNGKGNLISLGGRDFWVVKTGSEMKSYSLIPVIAGDSNLYMELSRNRIVFNDGRKAILYIGFILFAGLLFGAHICIYLVERITSIRLKTILKFIDAVGEKKNTNARITVKGEDEISRLAVHTNRMLEQIDSFYEEIRNREARFKLIMEAVNDGYFDLRIADNKLYISPEWLNILGVASETGIFDFYQIIKSIHQGEREQFRLEFLNCINGSLERIKMECRVRNAAKEWVWILIRGKIVEYGPEGNPVRLVGTIQDITEQKKAQEEKEYFSQTDTVTQLRNRAFMEPLLEEVDKCEDCKYWIIMGDVNGLKIINDSLGHQEGDRLLHTIGKILKDACTEGDIPARWGGDEFVILIHQKSHLYVKETIARIKAACQAVSEYPIKISIAMGYAQKEEKLFTVNDVLKTAEERMYRNKLLESQSARSSLLASLTQTLHEKHIETEEHTRRIEDTSLKIGNKMGLTQEELDELALLGLLHDIGKIGIPEQVLLKPDKLTEQEWEIMKSHAEIGYRIASATPELAHIAEKILSHHERFDGTGYPRGLKGNEIPKLSRLIAIVDTYDVMTHDRVYKKAMSMDYAAEELKRCAGKQFDPVMVDIFLEHLQDEHRGTVNQEHPNVTVQ